ncbi:MAG TPA: hypothetical protein VFX63_05315 [Pyrinomonadaceae bacterium]|nr:hypothetical protein [Pyrinomonadaceae bacterium]
MNFNHFILDGHSIRSDPIRYGQTFPTPYIKLPPMQPTLNHMPAERTLS